VYFDVARRGAPSVVLERDSGVRARSRRERSRKEGEDAVVLALDDKKLVVQRGARELETRPDALRAELPRC